MKTKLRVTREGPIKIGVKDIERVWRARAKDARRVVVDSERPGLSLITNATSQTWSYSYKPRGVDPETGKRFHTRSMTIGSPATHSPHEARVAANRIRGEVAAGGDPAAERKVEIAAAASKRASTVEPAVADYLAVLPKKEKRGGGRISTRWAKEQTDHLNHAVAALGIASVPLKDVDVAMVRKLQHGPVYRHRFGAVNRFLDWCVHTDRITSNPCASIGRAYRPAAGGKRERAPSLRELALIWMASEKALDQVSCDFVRFAICVPARRSEIANLRWEHLDINSRVWRQPGRLTKNREEHRLWLHGLAFEILMRRWEAAGYPKTGLVFPAPKSGGPLTTFSAMLRALHRAALGVESWSLHDLRRGFASTLGEIGENDEAIIDAILNHKQSTTRGGVLGVYNKSKRYEAQRAALERWGVLLKGAIEGRFPAKADVIPLDRARVELERRST